ncbi:CtsR family transcriptional regulator [Clostridium polynesiense]|uniref:CtsR family transcriptional regulator n=1 Tax=Clostridium polynesiense TaxID=1325933 RepID=UPI00059098BF|nr:CtsR family transcriptional regulator [Clostridium polynesiense]
MARLSDIIEEFIKRMLKEGDEELQIQRNELADYFSCAPSQINYVLTTRFTYDKGYIIESRRGGGGYIVIRKVNFPNSKTRAQKIMEWIGNGITYHNSLAVLESLFDSELITHRELEIIKLTLNERTLGEVDNKNKLRADILKAILSVILS